MKEINLDSFLYFGYSLEYINNNYNVDFSRIDKKKYAKSDEDELIRIGSDLLRDSVSSLFTNNDKHLVPLSGGSDSRALLALLLEHTDASSIKTYTFGTPKTFDFEIGNYLADKIGTNHVKFDLTKHIFTEEEFFDVSERIDYQSPLFLHPPVKELLNMFKDDIIWSGVNAGAVVGSFYRLDSAESYQEAQKRFIKKARYSSSNLISERKINGLIKYMDDDFISPDKLTYDEQVFFKERSIKHLAPHVLMKGFNYKTPFVNTHFMDFMLSVPNEFRLKKKLYKKILNFMYPKEFALKSETRYGYTAQAPEGLIKVKQKYVRLLKKIKNKYPKLPLPTNPMINYLDFNQAFRKNTGLKKLVYRNICDLKKRSLINHIDIDLIWLLHQNYKGNFAEEIITLFTLEIYLKQGVKLY